MGTIAAYDLGSGWLGVAIVAEEFPLEVLQSISLRVDPEDLDVVVAVAVEMAVQAGATRAAIEHSSNLYVPDGASKQKIMAMAEAHKVCGFLQRDLSRALEAAGITANTYARQSWAHRVVPHTQGGITTAMANTALEALCAPGSWDRLRDQHQRDAAGVACMWLIDKPTAPKRYRKRVRKRPEKPAEEVAGPKLTPPQAHLAAKRKRLGRLTPLERTWAGCVCALGDRGQGRHRDECPLSRSEEKIAAAVRHGSWLR
jgi:hypothetical protein